MGEAPTRYLNTRQAAALLGLSPRTLESYRVRGGGPPFLTYCNRVHYLRADLAAWAETSRRRSTSEDGSGDDAVLRRPGGPPGRTQSALRTPEGEERDRALTANGSGFFGVDELAALLQVSRRTLDRYRANGIGPAFEKVKGRVRYARADVEAWLAGSRPDPGADGEPAA